MQVTCSCGKVLNVPDRLAGKSARCPSCKKVFQMPAAAPAEPAPSRIIMECSCGKKLAAPASAAGKKVLCPKCNKELTVPGAAKAPPRIVPMPGPASHKVTMPTRSSKLAPAPKPEEEDLAFNVELSPPAALKAASLPDAAPPSQAEKNEYGVGNPRCPNCKAELPYGSQFCVECGTSLATGAVLKPMAKPGVKKRKTWSDLEPYQQKRIIWGVIGVIVLILLYWWIYKPHGMTASEMKSERAGEKGPGRPAGGPRGGGGEL